MELQKIRDTVALLNSMIYGGEQHSDHSEKVVRETLDSLDERIKMIDDIRTSTTLSIDDFSDLFNEETGSEENK